MVCTGVVQASMVRVETTLGVIDVELFDTAAPATVANFLSYVQSGSFDSTFFHRSVPGFVIQGGGFAWRKDIFGKDQVFSVTTKAPVVNEFSVTRSNLRGTVAMAKLGTSPDSATSQWFINLANNSANLDIQNGGFTVFGKVIGNGMTVVDAMAALPVDNINPFKDPPTVPPTHVDGPFDSVPLIYTGGASITTANLAMVTRVSVLPTHTLSLAAGWNLAGNGSDAPLNVATTFADAQRFVTVWKWVTTASGSAWAFYSPALAAQGGNVLAAYAASKGYQVLQSISAGEGYWVNVAANQAGTITVPLGNTVTAAGLSTSLRPGWNLAALGAGTTAQQFCAAQQGGVTTLWAWNNGLSQWLFYAPDLAAKSSTALADYIASKGYLDFAGAANSLGLGIGFWVNKP